MTRASTYVLIDQIPVARSLATDAVWVIAFSLATAACAQIGVHLPFSPVPVTGQTFAVLLSGAVLGWRRAFVSQIAYLVEGLVGLPVFADGASGVVHLVGPSGGFLLSFPLAAALVGYLVEKGVGRSAGKLAGALVSGDLLILLAGSAWLRLQFGIPFKQACLLGFYPFLITDVAKLALVGGALPPIVRWLEAQERIADDTGGARAGIDEL